MDRINEAVGIFFYVKGRFVLHLCSHENAEVYGQFLNYPDSHLKVWEENYAEQYGVDFDYFPRGRIIFDTESKVHIIYYDKCIGENIYEIADRFEERCVKLDYDEHYQCSRCNPEYIV